MFYILPIPYNMQEWINNITECFVKKVNRMYLPIHKI